MQRFCAYFENSIQYDMQYIPFYGALLAQETLFLPNEFQNVRKSRQILTPRQNSVC